MAQRRHLVNEMIRAPEVLVIDENGKNLGVMARDSAIQLARQRGLDLVQVAQQQPPVCKFMNYEKYVYQLEKKQRELQRQQRRSEPKEVKFGIRISEKDLETKLKRVEEFLRDGRKVRVVIWFRGWRERAHHQQGRRMLEMVKEKMARLARVETDIRHDGSRMYIMLAPRQEEKR